MNMEELLKIKNIYNNIPNEVRKARKSFFNNGNRANRLYIYYGIDDIEKTANEDKKLWFKSPKMYGDKEENDAWMSKFFHVKIGIENKKYCKNLKKLSIMLLRLMTLKNIIINIMCAAFLMNLITIYAGIHSGEKLTIIYLK